MKYYRRCFLVFMLFCWLILQQHILLAKSAQPGIWNAGGKIFTMLYPQDSIAFKKVQMQQERIYIQLYKGFTVVKGTYIFKNRSSESIKFKMGYPVNGIYSGGETELNQITLDSLSNFKIKANQQWLKLLKEKHSELHHDESNTMPFSDNWMVWQMAFAPTEIQTLEVYFIVNTNDAKVRSGYNLEYRNAFIYLLERGSVWHQPIEKGNFYIQLKDGLKLENLQGLSSGFDFKFNEQHQIFAGSKTNFSPTPKDNLVATYFEHIENFNFAQYISQSEKLYKSIDELHLLSEKELNYQEIKLGNPYEVKRTFVGVLPNLLMLFVMVAPYIIVILFLTISIWAFLKWRKIKKKKGA